MNESNGKIQNLQPASLAPALILNNAHSQETSLLDAASLSALISTSFYARGVYGQAGDSIMAMLIALNQNAAYDNPNFAWFRQRLQQFVYIDRVIVAGSARGQGIARALYLDLFDQAARAGQSRVVCEINLSPPNPASDAFHAAMGFVEIGQAAIHNGTKTVRYFEKTLA